MSVTNRRSLPLQFACLVIGVSSVLPAFAVLDTDATQKLAKASVPFIHNRGQWDKTAAFGAHTFAGTLFVTTEGNLVYNLPGKLVAGPAPEPAHGKRATAEMRNGERTPGWVLTETFVGSDQQVIRASPNGYLPATAKVSYFIGNDERRHRRDVGTFERVDLGDVFPGINVQLRATGANVEKIFTVAPGHDPAGIRVRIDGTTRLELGPDGELIAVTGNGPLAYSAPIAFQEDDRGVRHPVAVRYALDAQTRNYGFIVDTYDTTRALVIDPLLRSTYLGANGDDVASAIAIHPVSGEVYVAGSTSSMTNTFPGVGGGYQPSNGGGPADAFVSRYSPDLSTLYQSTYLGGGTNDSARALAIHPVSGDIYVAGYTFSLTNTFPGVNGGAQANSGGNQDGFVSRLSADLTVLRRSTYLGAGLDELANALAIHPVSGDIYVAGSTTATTNTFPGLAGATQGNSGGGTDGFVSRFSADLGTLFRSSYLGAGGTDVAQTLAVHPVTGEIYVAGYTNSPGTSFPGAG
ncbi:MAG: hypothetical protein ABI831_28010, partial [Betaproteobacteria bacterium]